MSPVSNNRSGGGLKSKHGPFTCLRWVESRAQNVPGRSYRSTLEMAKLDNDDVPPLDDLVHLLDCREKCSQDSRTCG